MFQRQHTAAGRRLGVFMLEQDMPGLTAEGIDAVRQTVADAITRVTYGGSPIRCFRSAYVSSHGRWLCLFVANSVEPLRRVAELAGLTSPRISQVSVAGPELRVEPGHVAERQAA